MSVPLNFSNPRRLPDPYDRTRNDPYYLMSSGDSARLVKTFYREEFTMHGADKVAGLPDKEMVTKEFLVPVIDKAKTMGWSEVRLIGKQLLFIAEF